MLQILYQFKVKNTTQYKIIHHKSIQIEYTNKYTSNLLCDRFQLYFCSSFNFIIRKPILAWAFEFLKKNLHFSSDLQIKA